MTPLGWRLALIAAGAVTSAALWHVAGRTASARSATWLRPNFRGRSVSLLGGPVVIAAALAGCAAVARFGDDGERRAAGATAIVVSMSGIAGVFDDVRGSARSKGLAGHLRALTAGRLTTGVVKVIALAAAGLVAALVLGGTSPGLLLDGILIAAVANLLNLFDLRPGRAAKLLTAGFLIVAGVRSAAAPAMSWTGGVAIGILGYDVRERLMLGDGGANALGAALGVGIVVAAPRPARIAVLAVAVGLTLLSERVSFSRVIDDTPALRRLDRLGRHDAGNQA